MKYLIRFLYFLVITFLQILAYGVVCEFILYKITFYTHSKDEAIGLFQLFFGAVILIPNIVSAFSQSPKTKCITAAISAGLFLLGAFVSGLHEYPDEFWAHVPAAFIVLTVKLGLDLLLHRVLPARFR